MTFLPKAATIGGTFSFNGRDSFSFQISGEIASAEDYIELAAFAGGALLGQFRDADPETLQTVRQFVSRFSSIPEADLPVVPPTRGSAPVVAPDPAEAAPPEVPPAPQGAGPAPAPKEAPVESPKGGGAVCEECGAAVSASQAKLSQLFMNKALCKTCMDKSQGVS